MLAIAVLACVMGYYIKNKFFKDDEDKEEKEKNEQKKTADMKFPAAKASKPWLNQGELVESCFLLVLFFQNRSQFQYSLKKIVSKTLTC